MNLFAIALVAVLCIARCCQADDPFLTSETMDSEIDGSAHSAGQWLPPVMAFVFGWHFTWYIIAALLCFICCCGTCLLYHLRRAHRISRSLSEKVDSVAKELQQGSTKLHHSQRLSSSQMMNPMGSPYSNPYARRIGSKSPSDGFYHSQVGTPRMHAHCHAQAAQYSSNNYSQSPYELDDTYSNGNGLHVIDIENAPSPSFFGSYNNRSLMPMSPAAAAHASRFRTNPSSDEDGEDSMDHNARRRRRRIISPSYSRSRSHMNHVRHLNVPVPGAVPVPPLPVQYNPNGSYGCLPRARSATAYHAYYGPSCTPPPPPPPQTGAHVLLSQRHVHHPPRQNVGNMSMSMRPMMHAYAPSMTVVTAPSLQTQTGVSQQSLHTLTQSVHTAATPQQQHRYNNSSRFTRTTIQSLPLQTGTSQRSLRSLQSTSTAMPLPQPTSVPPPPPPERTCVQHRYSAQRARNKDDNQSSVSSTAYTHTHFADKDGDADDDESGDSSNDDAKTEEQVDVTRHEADESAVVNRRSTKKVVMFEPPPPQNAQTEIMALNIVSAKKSEPQSPTDFMRLRDGLNLMMAKNGSGQNLQTQKRQQQHHQSLWTNTTLPTMTMSNSGASKPKSTVSGTSEAAEQCPKARLEYHNAMDSVIGGMFGLHGVSVYESEREDSNPNNGYALSLSGLRSQKSKTIHLAKLQLQPNCSENTNHSHSHRSANDSDSVEDSIVT